MSAHSSHPFRRLSRPDRHAPRDAVMARAVVAVPGLSKAVGAEGGAGLGGHDVVDPTVVGGVVEVVHPLVALVAEPAVVLEADRPCHGRDGTREEGAPWGALLKIRLEKGSRSDVLPGGA